MWTADRPPQWVGRGQELAILRAGAEALRRGEGAVVWVGGEPGIRLRLHWVTGMLQAGRGRPREALAEFCAAGRLQSQPTSPFPLGSQVTGWTLATQARLGLTGKARAGLAALAGDQAGGARSITPAR